MKISKVNHRRTAVGTKTEYKKVDAKGKSYYKQNKSEPLGIMYTAPAKRISHGSNIENTDSVIRELVKSAQRMYALFINTKIADLTRNRDERDVLMKIKNTFHDFICKAATKESIDWKKQKVKLDGVQVENFSLPHNLTKQEIVALLVDNATRKSLRKCVTFDDTSYYLPDIMKKIALALCFCDDDSQLKNIDQKEMFVFVSYVYEDKYKTKQIKKIEKSLQNQKTKVMVLEKDNKKRIQLSSAASDKKKYVSEYLIRYACASPDEQDKMRLCIRKWIVLYVCGQDVYDRIKDRSLDVWKWDGYEIPQEQMFLQEHIELLASNNKADINQIEVDIRNANITHYRNAIAMVKDEEGQYWFKHFEDAIEKLFASKSKRKPEYMQCQYLCEYLWKDWFPYVASKYVDIGKGVYHFAMPDLFGLKGNKEVEIGVVNTQYNKGITSFDYERIKAKETLERNLATYATFAGNVFAKAVVRDEYRAHKEGKQDFSDVLIYSDNDFADTQNIVKPDAIRRVMQYYGGESRWKEVLEETEASRIFIAMKNHIAVIRNSSFHYTAKADRKDVTDSIMMKFFEYDYKMTKEIYAAKYYSNNVWVFYSAEKVYTLMTRLYSKHSIRPAQIPAFNSVIKKKDMQQIINELVKKDVGNKIAESTENAEKYRASMFFLLKEIYYYGFLQESDLKEKFLRFVERWTQDRKIKDKNEIYARKDFKNRVDQIKESKKDITFAEICQTIMTDYNMQNQGQKSIKSRKEQERQKKNGIENSYQHFPMLLHLAIRELFVDYVKTEKEGYQFLSNPNIAFTNTAKTLEEFVQDAPALGIYTDLANEITKNQQMLDWYVLTHFLTPKQLNLLIGDIKNYIQFIGNIDQRADSIENRKGSDTQNQKEYYEKLLRIMEFTQLFIGRISNNIKDYFNDEDDYAEYLSHFIDFGGKDAQSIRNFCAGKIDGLQGTIGIYYDEKNPILNKNIAYAVMFGEEKILSKCWQRINEKEVVDYYKMQQSLQKVFQNGTCVSEKQQKDLKKFQNMKNRIELLDVMIYTDILNDFLSQMVSWTYLRERDLMYFQLGIHYLRLYYSDQIPADSKYRILKGDTVNISDGALLYQIVAMYTYSLHVYMVEGERAVPAKKQGAAGASIKGFVVEYCKETMSNAPTYDHGLELFEDTKRHDEYSQFRNDVAHMKYMAKTEMSIMEMISEIYNGFFLYDLKLKKSISFIFKNILMRYFVVAKMVMEHSQSRTEDQCLIQLCDKDGLQSDQLTYKYVDKDKKTKIINVDARDKQFLNQLVFLLEYKDKESTE